AVLTILAASSAVGGSGLGCCCRGRLTASNGLTAIHPYRIAALDIFVTNFANDLPKETAQQLWASQRAASTAAFDTPSRAAAWRTIPSWYFISTGDQIITPTSERAMAQRAHSTVTEFNGGSHLTLISHPDAVTAVIQSAINSVH
ncbi:MAG: alpha/beta fold hydrolase, partial [Pseudonocardiaceae bacterium]